MLEFLFTKITGLKGCSLVKKRLQRRCFPVNIAKFLRAPILKKIGERMLLYKKLNELIHDEPKFVPVKMLQSEPTTEGFLQKYVLQNFAIFTVKYLCWSHVLIKLQVFRPTNQLEINFNTSAFLWILRNL